MTKRSLEDVALQIFGSRKSPAYEKWVEYWHQSRLRNASLLEEFEKVILMDFNGKRVLDIGCGTGGLSEILAQRCAYYSGIDYHRHVLEFAVTTGNSSFLQSDGSLLPFRARSFDFIFAFDIIEHLEGGRDHQHRFLSEIRRVLTPLGMLFMTTPNYWYPYDAHSDLYFPQFIPRFLRDRYIRLANPGFLEEHRTFDAIHLVTPRFLKSALKDCGLSPLHELPCCLDRSEYLRLHPLRGVLAYLGLGWYLHAEFWTVLAATEVRSKLRKKLRRSWFYQRNQPDEARLGDFDSGIDFETGMFNHQLGSGWFWYEKDQKGFRWTEKRATCYLESRRSVRFIRLTGYSPIENRIFIEVDGVRVGEHYTRSDTFDLTYFLPFSNTADRIFEVTIGASHSFQPQDSADKRVLSLMIFSVRVFW